jgi:hypothetical protein
LWIKGQTETDVSSKFHVAKQTGKYVDENTHSKTRVNKKEE